MTVTLPINWDRPVTYAGSWDIRRLLRQHRHSADPRLLLMACNEQRRERRGRQGTPRRPQLQWSDELANAARFHAVQMATLGFYDHVSPLGDTPEDRAATTGYPYDVVELIGRGRCSALRVYQDWAGQLGGPRGGGVRGSDYSDCKAIIDPDIKVMGAAQYDWLWVAMFGVELP